MARFRITTDDEVDVRRLATALVEAHGWPREQVGLWNTHSGEVIVTVDDELLREREADPLATTAHTGADLRGACELLKRSEPSLRFVSLPELRDEVQGFFSAGWTVADLIHALRHQRDGAPWPTGEEYHAEGAAWLRHRMRSWRTPEGDVRPSRSQEAAGHRVVRRSGLPDTLGLPPEERWGARGVADPARARAAADDARRLLRAGARTTSDALTHRERTGEVLVRRPGHEDGRGGA
ncbi:hypothetical protein [Allonocardiopsis opalescens]|uniref:Uncharacterized protein n=1 Tax=Allonocardiopsis opalescens TaxID=1144618 RepID=A0A2T0QAQ3_9ACTN|nr:hypothetical protein [Allonocardiopsis opalescens]PRY00996.1 hypothetical protein CLV72_102629 [Allonocardiopsis opalescens]